MTVECIREVIDKNPILSKRNVAGIRTYLTKRREDNNWSIKVDGRRKRKSRGSLNSSMTKKRQSDGSASEAKKTRRSHNRIPEWIYRKFETEIQQKKVPDISVVRRRYTGNDERNFSIFNYSPDEVRNMVKQAIDLQGVESNKNA